MSDVRTIARETTPEEGVIRLEHWPEGYVLWHHGQIVWRSFTKGYSCQPGGGRSHEDADAGHDPGAAGHELQGRRLA